MFANGCRSSVCVTIILVSVFLQVCLSGTVSNTMTIASLRLKRSLPQLSNMVRIATKDNPMRFNNYGNHCGFGSDSRAPVSDDIDQCCRQHDICYGDLTNTLCYWSYWGKQSPYFDFYSWTAPKGNILCGNQDSCKKAICECDRTAAMCLAQHSFKHNPDRKRSSFIMRMMENVYNYVQEIFI